MAYDTLHDRLRGPIADALRKDLGRKNYFSLPRLDKIVVSTGINKSKTDKKEMHEYIENCMGLITGQKPIFTKARKAISNFKTREGMVVGAKVTLRGRNAEEFLDRLLSYALPRVRDFRGIGTKLDGQGNYCIGIRDHSIFPEVPAPDANQIFGLEVQIKTTSRDDEEARLLLKHMGVPFRAEPKKEPEEADQSKDKGQEASIKGQGEEEESGSEDEKTEEDTSDESSLTP